MKVESPQWDWHPYKETKRPELSLCPVGRKQENGHQLTRKRALTKNSATLALTVGLPVSRPVRNKCLLFKLLRL